MANDGQMRGCAHGADWALVAALAAAVFAACLALLYVIFVFTLSLAGLPIRYVAMVIVPLMVAVASALVLARRQSRGGGRGRG